MSVEDRISQLIWKSEADTVVTSPEKPKQKPPVVPEPPKVEPEPEEDPTPKDET